MFDFTFLTEEQIFDNVQLDIIKKYGTKCAITDFSILLGGYVSVDYYTSEGNSKKDRTGWWWTLTPYDNDARVVNGNGNRSWFNVYKRSGGARPALPYSSIFSIPSNGVRGGNGILEIEYGEYPQTIVLEDFARTLESAYLNRTINQTGKSYTTDSVKYQNSDTPFQARTHIEYEYNGRKYIRFVADSNCSGQVLSDGRTIQEGSSYWLEVEPIKWMLDERTNIALSKKLIFSGVQFNKESNYNGDFSTTDIKKFMDEYFSKEIMLASEINKTVDIDSNNIKNLKNAYDFDFKEVTEEELIKASLESNLAPFLHGKSSEGKSARIKQFDPDAEIVYLRNATPDSLNGKSVYNAEKNEMIDVPPTWYIKLKEKCEKEPDKLHIVFFDELTNALPSIQGMAFNIILDKEVNGKWKLPENARVAAAGNDLEDSLAANTMAEPLFNRFNHVYINTTVDDWLNWALTPTDSYERLEYKKEDISKQTKIHPAIYAYIACKKESVLRTKFTGIKPNADPRKWEMASKVLYKTNNPYMLRGLIGEELTNDFVAFCQTKVISIEDVIEGNYDEKIFEINSSEKYLTVLALSNVDEKNVEVIRSFIEKLGKDFLALFDSLWTMGNDERLETLMSIKQSRVKIKK